MDITKKKKIQICEILRLPFTWFQSLQITPMLPTSYILFNYSIYTTKQSFFYLTVQLNFDNLLPFWSL